MLRFSCMNFNLKQQKIIDSVLGGYLISAPVGTGKTTVLTERVITALNSGIKPEEILCLTFTNRAAEEMTERIKKRVNKKEIYDAITVSTFHGFCANFISAEAKAIGVNSDLVIFDDSEQAEIMKNILNDYPELIVGAKNETREALNILDRFYQYRLTKLEQEIGCKVPAKNIDQTLITIGHKYLKQLTDQNALDFNELVYLTIKTLYTDDQIRNKWASRFKFIQLDEFQDTHLSEYLVVKELAKSHKNISFIGDLDQTIYSWRGSEPYFITELAKKHFAPMAEMTMEVNYRSEKNVVEAVKSFLTSFKKSATGKIETNYGENNNEKPIIVFGGHNLNEEIGYVIDNINKIKKAEPAAKIAVLARAHFLITDVAEIFSQNNIAHITVDKYDFFRRQEVKDIYAYLKILFNKFDLESAYRLIQRPSRNIGEGTINSIISNGAPIGLKVSDFLSLGNYSRLEPFANLIKQWQQGRIVVLDTETTGTNPLKDEIIQIYAVEVVDGEIKNDFHFYLKTNLPVGDSFQVHGITDEFLKTAGREPKAVLSELKKFIGDSIVSGHNINFDLNMIKENGKRLKVDFEFKEFYDTLDISRRLVESENYKLNTLAKLFNLAVATHDAKDDVLATVGLLEVLKDKLLAKQKERSELFAKFSKKFIRLAGLIGNWQKASNEKRPKAMLEYLWQNSGLDEYYQKDKDYSKRLQSIESLKNIFAEKDELAKPADVVLRELINYASLVKDLDFLGLDQGKIPIVTVHQVKGLEFDYVFVVGVNNFRFPAGNNSEEEKRIFYVALTRAKKKIFISYSHFNERGKAMERSPFIFYIDSRYVDFV